MISTARGTSKGLKHLSIESIMIDHKDLFSRDDCTCTEWRPGGIKVTGICRATGLTHVFRAATPGQHDPKFNSDYSLKSTESDS